MKHILIFSCFFILMSCSKPEQSSNIKPIETYFSQSEMLPTINGCCSFSTLLQIKDNHFRHYYLNDQGDYRTIDIVDGLVKKENDSTFYLKPKLDSANQKLSYDSNEFFKQKFTKTKDGIESSSSFLTKKNSKDIAIFKLEKANYGNPYFQENFTLKKDSLIYDKMESADNESPKITQKKIKLNSNELQEINRIFDEDFWTEKSSVDKEDLYIYSYLDLGKGEFQIPLSSKIQNYFFVKFKEQKKL